MKIRLLLVPYDSGQYGEGMGAGPLRFIDAGIVDVLRNAGHTVEVETLEAPPTLNGDVATAFALHRLGAEAARTAVANGEFPLLLGGNCNSCIGTVAGSGAEGIIWFDAHGDFNLPDTTASGFFDGMGMAVLAGKTYRGLSAKTPGFQPIPGSRMIHVGGRDFDAGERENMRESGVTIISTGQIRQPDGDPFAWIDALPIERVHVHFDIDVLDPAVGTANRFPAVPGGLTLDEALAAIRAISRKKQVVSASLTAYQPEYDPNGAMLRAGVDVIQRFVAG